MEIVVTPPSPGWSGRKVFITGHTGFKGSWLCLWLNKLGCQVYGYSLSPPTEPNLFSEANVAKVLAEDTRDDLRNERALVKSLKSSQAEIVFHLAAQSLVRDGYRDPLTTFATNVSGTANVLEAVRQTTSVKAVVVVTTDKVYENREWPYCYREVDALGGFDPYSASKAAAEITTASYRQSFFGAQGSARIATARAGNVIGGGDWAKDRLVPDCLSAFAAGTAVSLRYPGSVRPWQHVLEPLSGYMTLAEKLLDLDAVGFDKAWNFGPDSSGDCEVGTLAELVAQYWGPSANVERGVDQNPHEAGLLRLDSTLARTALHWRPRWTLQTAVEQTVDWHKAWQRGDDMTAMTMKQIAYYSAAPVT